MKIINQTSDELVLKEGSGFNYLFSIGFMAFAVGFGYMMYASGTQGNLYLLALIPFTIGLLVFLFGSSVTMNINKSSGQIIYQKKRIIGSKTSNYLISDVAKVETRKNWSIVNEQNTQQSGFSSSSRRGLQLMTQSFLIMKNGKELNLDTAHGGTSTLTTIDAPDTITTSEVGVAKQVADFIGVPFSEIAPPQVSQ